MAIASASRASAVLHEEHRVVGDRVDLDLDDAFDVGERVAHRAVHLRDAAQAERVLEPVVGVRGQDLAAVQERPQVRGGLGLARVRSGLLHPGVEAALVAAQHFQAQRPGRVGDRDERPGGVHRERPDAGDLVGAADERVPFARAGVERLDPGPAQGLSSGQQLAGEPRLSVPEHRESDVGGRGEVSDGALRGRPGRDAAVEHRRDRPHEAGAHAAPALRQRFEDRGHDRAHGAFVVRRTDAARMAAEGPQLRA
jgi:hypothetical protein